MGNSRSKVGQIIEDRLQHRRGLVDGFPGIPAEVVLPEINDEKIHFLKIWQSCQVATRDLHPRLAPDHLL
jgi:hypothetical protein